MKGPYLKIIALSVSCLLLAACTATSIDKGVVKSDRVDVIIKNVTVIDAKNGRREKVDVFIAGDTILSVTKSGRQPVLDAQLIDGEGKYLIPGLWDAHIHLSYELGLDESVFFPLSLAYGVTSLRDTGGHLANLSRARELANNQPLVTPNLYIAGPLIDGAPAIYDGHSASYPNIAVAANNAQQAEKIVDELAADGVDFIKAYEMLDPETFIALVQRAKQHGLPVSAHVPLSMTVGDAVSAGVDDLQHLRNLEFACSQQDAALLQERSRLLHDSNALHAGDLRRSIHSKQRSVAINSQEDSACEEVINLLARERVYQTPTLSIVTLFSTQHFNEHTWQKTFEDLPLTVAKKWREGSAALSKRRPIKDSDVVYAQWAKTMVKRLYDRGVPIIAGTDSPIFYLTPGASLHHELWLMVESGLTPLQALGTATLAPAKYLSLEQRHGAISAGMVADLVLLSEDPMQDIANTLSIQTVIKSGHVMDEIALKKLRLSAAKK